MSKPNYLTPEGAEKLSKELNELKGPRRRDLAERLHSAIQQGDLSENGDYIETKREQGFLEGRIEDLEAMLRNAVIIQERNGKRETVEIGAHVTLREEGSPDETYHLVGPNEANPRLGKISHESPIGQAILGKRAGDVISANAPGGNIKLKIVRIE